MNIFRSIRRLSPSMLAAALVTAVIVLMYMVGTESSYAQSDWFRYQNSNENNGVTSVEMPGSYNEAAMKWGRQLVQGYTISFTPPLIIDGYLYTASNKKVYKIDRDTGEVKDTSDEMEIDVNYAMHPMTYCEEKDLLFIPLKGGRVQCVKASDLSLKWISKLYTGAQALSPIMYKDGMVYTGIWTTELTEGVYYGLDADTGETVWEFRPAEQTKETVARALPEFAKPTGASKPDNYYTYTALITVKPKDGYTFATDKYSKYWLSTADGKKYVPEGMSESSLVQSVVNGHAISIDVNNPSSAVIRARFDYYDGVFTQEGGEGQQSSIEITGLDTPVVGSTLDTSAVTDSPVTIEKIEWYTGDIPHGFYWAGPYASDDHLIFGSDDGQNNTFGEAGSATYTQTAVLYSVDLQTGELTDKIDGCQGDIRSTVVYHNGYIYFTTKGGRLYKVKLNSNGTFDHSTLSYFQTDGMMTASPVVHDGRIYVGVSGTGGQFNADGGHMFAVFRDDDMLTGSHSYNDPYNYKGSLIYTTQIAGYPQAAPILSTNTGGTGNVRLYFTYNAFPGGIYFLEDSAASTGTNHADATLMFKPETEMQQYCISPLCVDSEGTIYYKNDSGYMMAVAVNKAYLPSLDPDNNIDGISVKYNGEELEWNRPFAAGTLNYTLTAPYGADNVDIKLDVPDGMTAKINDEAYTGGLFNLPISEDASATSVTVSKNVMGKLYTRTYTLNLAAANNNANLGGLVINDSNTAPTYIRNYVYKEIQDIDAGANPSQQGWYEKEDNKDAYFKSSDTTVVSGKKYYEKQEKHTNTIGVGYDPAFDASIQKYVSRTYKGSKDKLNIWVLPDDPDATVRAYPVDSVGNTVSDMEEDGSIKAKGQNGKKYYPVYWIKGKISAEIKIVVTPPSGREEAKKEYNIELVRSDDYLDVGNDPLVLSISNATLYTSGSNRTISVSATYGDRDVTNYCTWYSSRPDIATVDASGNIAAQDKVGDAVVWARYGAQDTEDRPVFVYVRNRICEAPHANVTSGEYAVQKEVTLTSATPDAEIYYNIGEGNTAVDPPDKNSTKYTGPITLGEAGARKKYKIRAIATKDDFRSSEVADFDYTIDLREVISEVEISDLDMPAIGGTLDTDVTVSSGAVVSSLKWYKVSGETETEISGDVEAATDYRAKIALSPEDAARHRLSGSTLVKSGDKYLTTVYENDTLTAIMNYRSESKKINEIVLTGIKAPVGGASFSNTVYTSTDGISITSAEWKDKDGGAVPETAGYNTEYVLHVTAAPSAGYSILENAKAYVNIGGETQSAGIKLNGDGTCEVTYSFRTAKEIISEISVSGLTPPEPGEAFDTDITVPDEVKCDTVTWYKVTFEGEQEVSGNAEGDTSYRVKLLLSLKDASACDFADDVIVRAGDRTMSVKKNEDGGMVASIDYRSDSWDIDEIVLTGVKAPVGGAAFSNTVYTSTEGMTIKSAVWKDKDGGNAPETADYNTEYVLYVTAAPSAGYSFTDDAKAYVSLSGETKEAGIKLNGDGTCEITYSFRTEKEIISEISVTDLSEPEAGEAFDTEISLPDKVKCDSVTWYRLKDGAEEAVTGNARKGESYRVKLVISPADKDAAVIADDVIVNTGDRTMSVRKNEDGSITAGLDYIIEITVISKVSITGVAAPEGGAPFGGTAHCTTVGAAVDSVIWKETDGSAVPDKAEYNKEYAVHITVKAEDGYTFGDKVTVEFNRDGTYEEVDAAENEDGTYTAQLTYKTAKVKLTGIILMPDEMTFDNGVSIEDIRKQLKAEAKVIASTEDGNQTEISGDGIYWDEKAAYDPNDLNPASFSAVGKVTLPDHIDPAGDSLTVYARVNVKQGVVQVPVMTPAPGTYSGEQTVTFSCPTKGAAIMFTRSDQSGNFTYEEPLKISGESGKKIEYKFKAFAMVNGITSETVLYTITIDRTPEAADASKNSKDKITPNEIAAQAALVNKKASKVAAAKVTVTGNPAKGTLTLKYPKVSGTVNYRIEYRKAGSKSWYFIWSKGKTAAAVKGLKKGAMYEFRIAPYRITKGFWQRGPWSKSIYTYLMRTTAKAKSGKKAFTATVKKVKKATGYKVRYSLKKNMSSAKLKTFKGASKTKLKIKKLKAKKTYYFSVCPYRKYGGKTYVGIWSVVKKVKTK